MMKIARRTEIVRKTRAITYSFDPVWLVDRWRPIVAKWSELKTPPWCWSGSEYPKVNRSHGPHKEALETHADPLLELANLAPSGFPSHTNLSAALYSLHTEFGIFNGVIDKDLATKTAPISLYTRVSNAADVWRVMLKHVVDLKASRLSASVAPAIKKLYDALSEAPLSSHPFVADKSNASSRASSPHMPSGSQASSGVSTPRTSPCCSDRATVEATIPRNQDGFPDFKALESCNPYDTPQRAPRVANAEKTTVFRRQLQYVGMQCVCPECRVTISDSEDDAPLKQQDTSSAKPVGGSAEIQTSDTKPRKLDSDDELAGKVIVPNPIAGGQRSVTLKTRPTRGKGQKKGQGKGRGKGKNTCKTKKTHAKEKDAAEENTKVKRPITSKCEAGLTVYGTPTDQQKKQARTTSTRLKQKKKSVPARNASRATMTAQLDAESMPPEIKPSRNASRTTTKAPIDQLQILKLPIKVRERKSVGKEGCYLMQAKGNGPEYVIAFSAIQCASYKELCQTLADRLNNGTMQTRQECRDFAAENAEKFALNEFTADA